MAKKTNTKINGKDYFRITKTIGKKADGTPIRKQFYGESKREAEEKANEYMNNLKLGLINNGQVMTINILLPKWLFSVKKLEIKPSSFECYEGLYRNYIKDYLIADLPINELKSLKIQEYYDELLKNNVSASIIRKTHKLLRQFFVYTEKEGFILKNPCTNVSLPKLKKVSVNEMILNKKTKFDYFTEEELPQLLDSFKNTKYYNIIIFAIGTGMRQGEILGLKWDNLDFDNKEIHVVGTLSRIAKFNGDQKTYETVVQDPKTENSIRIIPMSSTIYNMLKNIPHTSEFVFSVNESFVDAKDLQKIWKKTLLKNNIPYRKFHDLRHTFATLLLMHGANLVTLKELLGHSSIKITEIYLDALPKAKKDIVEKINLYIN